MGVHEFNGYKWHMIDSLFEILDVTHDGAISRSDLHLAAKRMGWHWDEAPIFALLDLLTIPGPMRKHQFAATMQQVRDDPMGPYGRVLMNSAHFSSARSPHLGRSSSPGRTAGRIPSKRHSGRIQDECVREDLVSMLERTAGRSIAGSHQRLLQTLDESRILINDAALLVIDPQKSFTQGVWMQSMGAEAAVDIEPIAAAFKNCAGLLNKIYGRREILFTRCPFPPGSYDWDDCLAEIIDNKQLYFIKPGNSVLIPPCNGFREWVERCIESGKNTLVIGGCTLNSCVRVSSIETLRYFKSKHLRIVVDLSICGARTRNFRPSLSYNGLSAVESAVHQMTAAGVQVVRRVEWQNNVNREPYRN
jgi:nicotinamidase-related amidase